MQSATSTQIAITVNGAGGARYYKAEHSNLLKEATSLLELELELAPRKANLDGNVGGLLR